ncbi:MAG: hypothetical protein J6U51_00335, partial [Bacteroidales bacterium]|nr:hypothetical protein [Bacteroidales bacterium]
NRKSQFEWVYKQSEAAGVYSAIMSGVEEFGLDDFTIRFDPAGNDNLMEFKFYRGANWGLDFKSVDSRANCDWNYINVYNYRLISDGSFVDIIGPKTMSVDESILEQVPTVSTINVDSAGTITAGWDSLGILSSMNYAAYRLEFAWDGEQDSKWGIGQLKYWFRQNETVSDETKLYYYVCAEVPIDGVLYKGLWKWAEWDYPDPFTAQSWTQVQ